MTIEKLLESLYLKREQIDAAIREITAFQGKDKVRQRAKEITDTVKPVKKFEPANKGFKYNGTHWTQKPENKARLKKMMAAKSNRRIQLMKRKQYKGPEEG